MVKICSQQDINDLSCWVLSLVGISELDNNKGNVVGDAYCAVVTMNFDWLKIFFIRFEISQRVIGRDRSFVIKIDRIGSDEIRKSSNALRDSISAF